MSLEARLAIEEFETLAKGIILRGYYRPGGESGASLRKFMTISRPALYQLVEDPDRLDADALLYVLMRLPDGIWSVRQITVVREISGDVAEDFSPVETKARRRPTFRTGPDSFVTAFRGGMSDMVDFISAITCFQIEADKIRARHSAYLAKLHEDPQHVSVWRTIESGDADAQEPGGMEHLSLLHELSVEFRCGYGAIKALDSSLGGRLVEVIRSIAATGPRDLKVVFSDRFGLVGSYSARAKRWTSLLLETMRSMGLSGRRVHIVSSNRHSIVNCLSPYLRRHWTDLGMEGPSDYAGARTALDEPGRAQERAAEDAAGGIRSVPVPPDMPFCQIIDLGSLDASLIDPRLAPPADPSGVILNMDYAFGEEGFFIFNEMFESLGADVSSVYVMGKAGTLVGGRGDIMLPSYFVKQGSGDVYEVDNCLAPDDFEGTGCARVYSGGPMLTVSGTFLQNEGVLTYFRDNWKALGVEMEGIPYARAVKQALLRGRLGGSVRVGVVYYASDAPLSGDLLSVPLGGTGVMPAYAASLAILRSIMGGSGGGPTPSSS
ncbi:MAG TPA: hypothetical protein PLF04_07500 [Candidatus Fermentibacter daniensis]|nr:MAG: hypothetical protein BWX47_01580 [candidate division Hyd24-12 bacterium ADurb.Bin004]HOZ18165.1 hypothetical protein [Candidatus Fermentibacter daniensis]HPH39967.1 hypothetical protein [Candidatus Fermentibacter daniensis]HPN62967.1 hypothetical protein [Candidatus Fermentibacter daniensis]